MAKLNVEVLDMNNGEITRVAYDGAEYAKVGGISSDVITEGDIAYVKTSRTAYFDAKSFYEFIEQSDNSNYLFKDNYGHRTGISNFNERTVVFRKISMPTLEERVSSLESDVAALKGENVEAEPKRLTVGDFAKIIDEETIEFEGVTYRKVDRKAREGDVVIFRKNTSNCSHINKPYLVTEVIEGSPKFYEEDRWSVYFGTYGRTRETVDVYEAQYFPQVGDIVVVTGNTSGHSNSVGDIGKVGAEKPLEYGGVKVYVPGNSTVAIRTKPQDIRKATPAEVEAYEKAAHKASFAVGDYVKIVKSYRGNEGVILRITGIGNYRTGRGPCEFKLEALTGKTVGEECGATADQIVKATDAEIAKATAPKLKAGDFVKITRWLSQYDNDKAYEIVEKDGKLGVIDEDGDFNPGAIRAEKYEIVDAETAKWAKIGRKVGELKRGDIVRIMNHIGARGFSNGQITEVTENSTTSRARVGSRWSVTAELIAPVESTVA